MFAPNSYPRVTEFSRRTVAERLPRRYARLPVRNRASMGSLGKTSGPGAGLLKSSPRVGLVGRLSRVTRGGKSWQPAHPGSSPYSPEVSERGVWRLAVAGLRPGDHDRLAVLP